MELLDAQIIYHTKHVRPDDPTLSYEERISGAVEAARVSLDAVGVQAALLHNELPLVKLACERYPTRFGGVVAYTINDPIPDAEEAVGTVVETPGLVAIRLIPGWPQDGRNLERLRSGAYDPLLAEAQKQGVPITFFMSGVLTDTHAVAQRFPELKLVIDHLGVLPAPEVPLVPERFDKLDELLALAQYPNIAVKMTGTHSMTFEPFPFSDLWPYLHRVLDTFGTDRVVWGSDFVRASPLNTYADAVRFILETDEISPAEKKQITNTSVRTWFDWNPTDPQ